ncbi:hypothetical protein DFJ73DRAFT_877993 [Zopfochytrium polystomum]|nr:hypothetical protein DFJ73DRAFT_877993 [Zopfochytrium polystomum]
MSFRPTPPSTPLSQPTTTAAASLKGGSTTTPGSSNQSHAAPLSPKASVAAAPAPPPNAAPPRQASLSSNSASVDAELHSAVKEALAATPVVTAIATAELTFSSHPIVFRRRVKALIDAANAALSSPAAANSSTPPNLDPVLISRLARVVMLASSSGWLFNFVDIDSLLADLEAEMPGLPTPSPADVAEDEKERDTNTFLIDSMRNNTSLLKSDFGAKMDDAAILSLFRGHKKESDLSISEDARVLGGGSFGVVKVARFQGRPCAVKIPKSADAAKESMREAAMLLKLNPSPHIVGVLGICHVRIDGALRTATLMKLSKRSLKDRLVASDRVTARFFKDGESVIEYSPNVEPVTRFDSLVAQGMLRWSTKVKIARDIILGVSYMHQCGIIHGDLKPGNILLDEYDNAKLCDVGASASADSINVRGFAFTPGYIPPIAVESKRATFFNDVFAYGKILMEIAGLKNKTPQIISKISSLCLVESTTAETIADLVINLFGNFDDWDADALSMPRYTPALASTTEAPSTDAQPDDGYEGSLAYQFVAGTIVMETHEAAVARRLASLQNYSTRVTLQQQNSVSFGLKDISAGSASMKKETGADAVRTLQTAFPAAYELWRLSTSTNSAPTELLIQMIVIQVDKFELGKTIDSDALRNALDYFNSGHVDVNIFLALVKANGGLDGVLRRYVITSDEAVRRFGSRGSSGSGGSGSFGTAATPISPHQGDGTNVAPYSPNPVYQHTPPIYPTQTLPPPVYYTTGPTFNLSALGHAMNSIITPVTTVVYPNNSGAMPKAPVPNYLKPVPPTPAQGRTSPAPKTSTPAPQSPASTGPKKRCMRPACTSMVDPSYNFCSKQCAQKTKQMTDEGQLKVCKVRVSFSFITILFPCCGLLTFSLHDKA